MTVERLRLACGCVEIGEGVWTCADHQRLVKSDPEDACEALYAARAAIAHHRIVTVTDGGGVIALEGIPLPAVVSEFLSGEAMLPGAVAGYPWCEVCHSYHPPHPVGGDE